MRYVGDLITAVRRHTKNEDTPSTTTTVGISDEDFIRYLNDAQQKAQSLISNAHPTSHLFDTEEILSIVANQEAYSVTGRVMYNRGFNDVQFSSDGTLTNYTLLKKIYLMNRDTSSATWPVGYFVRNGQIFLNPIPSGSSGKIRVTYERLVDDLDKRRGTISAVGGTNPSYTSITLSASGVDDTNLAGAQYVCVNDAYGNVTAYNIPVGSYNSSTHVITISNSYAALSTETIDVGSYVTIGKYTTTHSKLPDNCERYLFHSCAEEIFHRDSSDDEASEASKRAEIEREMVQSIVTQSSELHFIPMTDEWW